jgi:hypothetical protein
MLAIERRNLIIEKLNAEGKVIVSSLSREFSVTEETIRRDIEKLSLEGLAIKTHGGAISNVTQTSDLPYNLRKKSNIELKQRIAEKVASMIKDGDKLMLDASSTAINYEFAPNQDESCLSFLLRLPEHLSPLHNPLCDSSLSQEPMAHLFFSKQKAMHLHQHNSDLQPTLVQIVQVLQRLEK